ncbi:hypothetical protein KAT92_06550 [Candidatus Babeliales bacterium]|nr:hypothetical protein [Candidatus Babeliales bacterium]
MRIKQGDSYPLRTELKWDDGTAIDLTTATGVDFVMTLYGGSVPTVNAACVIVDADDGIVQYEWGASETDVAGMYICEWEITFSSGDVYTVPTGKEEFLWIIEQLA